MTEYLCKAMLKILYKNKIIEEENNDVYHYGLELILVTIFKFLGLMIIAFITGLVAETFIFTLFFSKLRLQAGGYHSKKAIGCFIYMVFITFTSISLVKLLPIHSQLNYILGSIIISIYLVFLYAPLENKNKPSTKEKNSEYRYRSMLTVLVGSISILFLIYFNKELIYFGSIASTGFLMESLTLIHSRKIEYN